MSRFSALRSEATDEELATGEEALSGEAAALEASFASAAGAEDDHAEESPSHDTPPERARARLAALQLRHEAEEARPPLKRRENAPKTSRDAGAAAETPTPTTPRQDAPARAHEEVIAASRSPDKAPPPAIGVDTGDTDDAAVALLLSRLPHRVTRVGPLEFELSREWAPAMRVPARFFANTALLRLLADEAADAQAGGASGGGFSSALQQLANVATLPGIVGASLGMPDIHSGYGFAIGNVAGFDLSDPQAVVSPGGVGFDINCGVRLLRTDLRSSALEAPGVLRRLADALYRTVPVGTGSDSRAMTLSPSELDDVLRDGMAFLERRGLCTAADRDATEERGAFPGADPARVSDRAKTRAKGQAGTLGAGNHYLEVQIVDAIYDEAAAAAMGLQLGAVAVMLHTGSRGLGHQVCTDYLQRMDAAKDGIKVVDRQLACVRADSALGRDYLAAMRAAANFAFVNRTVLANDVRRAFTEVFGAGGVGMRQVYDVAHNVAKEEQHALPGGGTGTLLVHRKGATRAFPPGHPAVPARYASIGQPVLVGGSMSTSSYVLVGTAGAMERSFGSTCHGAGRALSRAKALRTLSSAEVLHHCEDAGIEVRVQTRRLAAEEAAAAYKDVEQVVQTCHDAGISRLVAKLRPVISVKG